MMKVSNKQIGEQQEQKHSQEHLDNNLEQAMTFIIKYEDGPCAWNANEVRIEAETEEAACAVLKKSNPRAMITSVIPVAE